MALGNKINNLLVKLKQHLTAAKQPQDEAVCPEYICRDYSCVELLSSSNSVIRISLENESFYFVECRKHVELKEFVRLFVEDYYLHFTPWREFADLDRAYLLDQLIDSKRFESSASMGYILDSNSSCARFLRTSDPEVLGLSLTESARIERLKHFVEKYAWCQLGVYKLHKGAKAYERHTKSTNKALATFSLSKCLGITDLITPCEYCRVVMPDGKTLFGLRTDTGMGASAMPMPLNKRREIITPRFQRCMSTFHILDTITHDMDHSPNNYNIVTDEYGMAVGLAVFDNNDIGAYPLKVNVRFNTYKNCEPLITKQGMINLPHMDKQLAKKLEEISFSEIYATLSPYLRCIQIIATWGRIKKLNVAVRKTKKKKKDFLLNEQEWTMDTISEEIGGACGKTYLCAYLEDCCSA